MNGLLQIVFYGGVIHIESLGDVFVNDIPIDDIEPQFK